MIHTLVHCTPSRLAKAIRVVHHLLMRSINHLPLGLLRPGLLCCPRVSGMHQPLALRRSFFGDGGPVRVIPRRDAPSGSLGAAAAAAAGVGDGARRGAIEEGGRTMPSSDRSCGMRCRALGRNPGRLHMSVRRGDEALAHDARGLPLMMRLASDGMNDSDRIESQDAICGD